MIGRPRSLRGILAFDDAAQATCRNDRGRAEWARRFESAWGEIVRTEASFDERFRRLWRFYLAYCEAGFRSGRTDVIQMGLMRV